MSIIIYHAFLQQFSLLICINLMQITFKSAPRAFKYRNSFKSPRQSSRCKFFKSISRHAGLNDSNPVWRAQVASFERWLVRARLCFPFKLISIHVQNLMPHLHCFSRSVTANVLACTREAFLNLSSAPFHSQIHQVCRDATRQMFACQHECQNEDRERVWVEHQGAALSLWFVIGSSSLTGEVY